jgi:hypothetical protein
MADHYITLTQVAEVEGYSKSEIEDNTNERLAIEAAQPNREEFNIVSIIPAMLPVETTLSGTTETVDRILFTRTIVYQFDRKL